MRSTAAVAICLLSVCTTGCFDIEQTLTLERNLSGKAGFAMKVNMEPMVGFMAGMMKAMEGEEGAPTAEELAAARKELLQSSSTVSVDDFEDGKQELRSKLPAGVTLLDAKFQQDDLKMAVDFAFGFDTISKLKQITLPESGDQGGGPGNPLQDPFKDLNVVDEGATILITGPVVDPMSGAKDSLPPDPKILEQIGDVMAGLRVAFKITAPFDVVETTAHRREGTTLIWEFDMTSMQKLTPEQLAKGISVRYRK